MVKLIESLKHAQENGHHFFGFEFAVPTTEAGMITLYDRIERISSHNPLFCSITWGDSGSTAESSIEIAATCQTLLSINFQVNITGYTSTSLNMITWLKALKEKGVQNLLLTRGKIAAHECRSGTTSLTVEFPYAVDLIIFVRKHFGDSFGIAVAAFPETVDASGTSQRPSLLEMEHLRAKVDAGADFIITHFIFDVDVYGNFCQECRKNGIVCPILPGVLPVSCTRQLGAFDVASLQGASKLQEALSSAKQDGTPSLVTSFFQDLIQGLLASGAPGVYLFALPSEGFLSAILKGISLHTYRALPWKLSENDERRQKETVRPIHWSSRVTSYMVRTAQWKDFHFHSPNHEKWGASPVTTGVGHPLSDSGGYHAKLLLHSRAKRCAQFLSVAHTNDIPVALAELSRIFLNFLDGNGALPWSELAGETEYVNDHVLKPLNARGFFTINSQPHVNGVPSSSKVVGWGPKDGHIFQKEYIEFFCPVSALAAVVATLEKFPSLQYLAMNHRGKLIRSRWPLTEGVASHAEPQMTPLEASGVHRFGSGVTAVTWGVFPGREVIQPTIVSIDSFRAWVEEAFDLWSAPFFSGDLPPVIRAIQADWVLVNVVDNVFQESPSPLEKAMGEICSKFPPLAPIPIDKDSLLRLARTPQSSHGRLEGPEDGSLASFTRRYTEGNFSASDIDDFFHQQRKFLLQTGS